MINPKKNLLKLELGLSTALLCGLGSLAAFAEGGDATAAVEATAAATAEAGTQDTTNSIWRWLFPVLWIAIIIVGFYFLILRPQKKRKQQEEDLRSSLMLGDEITTIGGICGKIVNIKDDNITIESSIDRTLMEVKNWAIRDVKKLVTDDDKKEK
ncbi:MAG: preprotein translocase subunit YajC [Clostridia bacterium]|nr:preprotein translocase subunit YajC [Clostridia bacterium]